MEKNEYQLKAMSTCMPSCENVAYMLMNLFGEVGELMEKVAKKCNSTILAENAAKLIRFGQVAKIVRKQPDSEVAMFYKAMYTPIEEDLTVEELSEILKECGDIDWQLNGFLSVLGIKAEDVARCNLDKLASRQERGVIDGNGDNR